MFNWHCCGCLYKRVRRCAAQQAPATDRPNTTKNEPQQPPKKQGGG